MFIEHPLNGRTVKHPLSGRAIEHTFFSSNKIPTSTIHIKYAFRSRNIDGFARNSVQNHADLVRCFNLVWKKHL